MSDQDLELSPREELLEIVRGLHGYLEWHALTGTSGFVRQPRPPVTVTAAPSAPEPEDFEEVGGEPEPSDGELPAPTEVEEPAPPAFESAAELGDPPASFESAAPLAELEPAEAVVDAAPKPRPAAALPSCAACEAGLAPRPAPSFEGERSAPLWFVTEAVGASERGLLEKMIAAMKLPAGLGHCVVSLEAGDAAHRCPSALERVVGESPPRIVVAFGALPLTSLFGARARITRGQWKNHKLHTLVMPTHSLQELGGSERQALLKRESWSDLQLAMQEIAKLSR